ncbi:hypothetical protein IscW_ISCW013116 [Ixodes scapularis]|uniref:Uncharacterized protein n=1 Tax=Ixodes scapularis TaxID=6945 RepID=B7QEM0_IXOSC|nr:hypothetical protein IscW_ISCW013116 [Ixodes scapularis]|eukprot:XP_002413984.1 hypothetical protein IscW_ISCW013116 [Ixodes scapularis]
MRLAVLLLLGLLSAEAILLPITIKIIVPKFLKPLRLGLPLTALFTFKALAFLTSLFRRRRDLSSHAVAPARTVTLRHDEADEHIERLFSVLEANDPRDCFKRAICQLEAAQRQRPLNQLEQFFVGLEHPQVPDANRSREASFPFQYAAFIGYASRSAQTCQDTYSRCPLEPGELLRMYAARGEPRLQVQGATAAVSLAPCTQSPLSFAPRGSNTLSGMQSAKPSSGYGLLRDMLRGALLGGMTTPKPSDAADDSRAFITIHLSGR